MDGVIKMDDARALVSDASLWPRVRDFLWDFAPQVHKSWLDGIVKSSSGEEVFGGRRVSDMLASRRVRQFALARLGVKPLFHPFPKEDFSRMALLDCADLESIVNWLGALACAKSLRRVTDGASVRVFKSALVGVYPDVFSFTAYFKDLDAAAKDLPDVKDADGVRAAGFSLLLSIVSGLPAPIVDRMRLKLPRGLSDAVPPAKVSAAAGAALKAKASLPKLLKLIFPEAYSLCC